MSETEIQNADSQINQFTAPAAEGVGTVTAGRPADSVAALRKTPRYCFERAALVTESYRETVDQPSILRRARALEHLTRHMTVRVRQGEPIVGGCAATPGGSPLYPELDVSWLEGKEGRQLIESLDPDERERVETIVEYWRDRSALACASGGAERCRPAGGREGDWVLGCATPDYERIFRLGLTGVISELRHHRCVLSSNDPGYREQRDYYDAAEISARAVVALANRYAEIARSQAGRAFGKVAADYEAVAHSCERVPYHPPETFQEALQAFFFCHLAATRLEWKGGGLSQRFDQIFLPYYERDKAAGKMTYEHAVELLSSLLARLNEIHGTETDERAGTAARGTNPAGQYVTIGGVDAEGRDATNELSFAVLDAAVLAGTPTPNIAIRYHDGLDSRLVERAVELQTSGRCRPVFFNDAVGLPWHFNALLTHLDPATARKLGIGRLDWADNVRNSAVGDFLRFATAQAGRILSSSRQGTERGESPGLSYKLGAHRSLLWRGVSTALDYSMLFDSDQALALARRWAPGATIAPGIPGLVFRGGETSGTAVDLRDLVEALLRPGSGDSGTVDPRSFRSFHAFLDAFSANVARRVAEVGAAHAARDGVVRELLPRPFNSALMRSCNTEGHDMTQVGDGAYSEVTLINQVEAANALAAIKQVVFDEASVSMDELLRAVAADFSLYDNVREALLAGPKVGRGEVAGDDVYFEMCALVAAAVRSKPDHFGRPYECEASRADQQLQIGESLAA